MTEIPAELPAEITAEIPAEFAALLRPYLRFAGAEPIAAGTDLRRLGLDSMQAIELLFAIEDEFGVSLADDLLTDATFQTAGSLWAALRRSADLAAGPAAGAAAGAVGDAVGAGGPR